MLKVLAPDGTPIITTLLVLSVRVKAPPIAKPAEKSKDVKHNQFEFVAVPVAPPFRLDIHLGRRVQGSGVGCHEIRPLPENDTDA